MRYVSVFSGVEAATLAFEPLGWEPVCFCEVDDFPSQVLRKRFPRVPNLGDIREVKWKEVLREWGPVDLVVGGSPCQSFSIAGNRAGLEGESGLMWEYVRCVREIMPRWLLWENVPGALSSSNGEDFRCLLESLDDLGYGLAWRVLDAQFFGVPQRRRRVFVVGSLGDRRACEVLLEPEMLSWDSPSSKERRAELTAGSRKGSQSAGFKYHAGKSAGSIGYEEELSHTLTADYHNPAVLTQWDVQSKRIYPVEGVSPTLQSGKGEGANIQPIVFGEVVCMADTQAGGAIDVDMCGTIMAHSSKQPPIVAFAANQRGDLRLENGDGSIMGTLQTSRSGKQIQAVTDGYILRRLTPLECERLQGMPDGWTDIEYKGKPAPDTLRYKAIGNSMAVNVMRWLGERIERTDSIG